MMTTSLFRADSGCTYSSDAAKCFAMADAMLNEREKKS